MTKLHARIFVCLLASVFFLMSGSTGHAATKISFPTNSFGMVGYWTFDGYDMTPNVRDRSGNGNHGNLTGQAATTTVPGKLGQALKFDGSDDAVSVTHHTSLNPSEISISFWINILATPSTNNGSYLNKNGTSGYRIRISGTSGFQFLNNGSIRASANNLGLNTWAHVVLVANANGSLFYTNGVAGTLNANAYVASASSGNLAIAGSLLNGLIMDDVRIYNRALSAGEVTALYNLGAGSHINSSQSTKVANGLVGLWSFNGPDISGTTAYDRSGQGNNGTLTGSPIPAPGKSGQAMKFDGVDDYVTTALQLPSSGAYSVSFWMKGRPSGLASNLFAQDISGEEIALSYNATNDAFSYENTYQTSDTLGGWNYTLDNNWHHIVLVEPYSGADVDNASFYVDGVLMSSLYTGIAQSLSAGNLHIGARPGGSNFYTGTLDEFRVYNRALSASEVQQLYGGGNVAIRATGWGQLSNNLIAYWKLNEESGTRSDSVGTSHLTPSGSVGTTTGLFGNAISLHAISDDQLSSGSNDSALNLGADESFTYAFWLKTSSGFGHGGQYLLTKYNFPYSFVVSLGSSAGGNQTNGIKFSLTPASGGTATEVSNTTLLLADTWYFVVAWHDKALDKIYVQINNGTPVSADHSTGTWVETANLVVGASPFGNRLNGYMDEIGFWKRVLTSDERTNLYNAGAGLRYPF